MLLTVLMRRKLPQITALVGDRGMIAMISSQLYFSLYVELRCHLIMHALYENLDAPFKLAVLLIT